MLSISRYRCPGLRIRGSLSGILGNRLAASWGCIVRRFAARTISGGSSDALCPYNLRSNQARAIDIGERLSFYSCTGAIASVLPDAERHTRNMVIAMNERQQTIFEHLQQCTRDEEPEQVIERYRKLFLQGTAYPLPRILAALERLARGQTSQEREEFAAFVGRCWYLAVDAWLDFPEQHGAIAQLAGLFDEFPPPARSRSINRVREGGRAFMASPQYLRLRRLGNLIARHQTESPTQPKQNAGTIGSSLVRYPFLYEYCFLRADDNKAYRKRILQSRETNQNRFEERLSRYAVGLIRERFSSSHLGDPTDPLERERTFKTVKKNPTQLSQESLTEALQHFLGAAETSDDSRDLAKRFHLRAAQCKTYREFKASLCDYALAAAKPKYVDRRLRKALEQFFEQLQPERDRHPPEMVLRQRAYCQLLNFLVVESEQEAGPLLYLDAIAQQGAIRTITILLKVVLLAPEQIRPHLEARFGILFDRYDGTPRDEVPWLVKSLEFWQLVHTIYFREADLSIWKQLF